jgi:hypothetical protein
MLLVIVGTFAVLGAGAITLGGYFYVRARHGAVPQPVPPRQLGTV